MNQKNTIKVFRFFKSELSFSSGCEYGDHAPWLCAAHGSCDTNHGLCCFTCFSRGSILFQYDVELRSLKLSLHSLALPLIAFLFSRIISNS